MKIPIALCVAALAWVGCGKPEAPAPEVAPPPATSMAPLTGTATIAGKVVFRGDAPLASPLRMRADPFCEAAHSAPVNSEEVLVNTDGTLQNVFVYIQQGLEGRSYPPVRTPVVLDQVGCLYRPRVLGIQTGQPLLIRNSDDTLHNVHALANANAAFNLGQPVRGMESRRVFTQPEVMVRFKCDVHPWMTAYLGVVPHPFHAVTGAAGAFTLRELPAGSYRVAAWHEKLGVKTATLEVPEGGTATVEFTYP
jgi:hypothetical protein